MNKLYIAMSGFLILATLLISCKEEDLPAPDNAYNVSISIIEPSDAQILDSGSELHLEATFENDATIYNIGVYIIGETMGDTLYQFEDYVDIANYYEFHDHYTPIVAAEQEYQILFTSWGEDVTKRIESHVHITITP